MKIRLVACLAASITASMLSGCVQSCYKSDDTLLTQVSIGDPSEPDASIPRFPPAPTYISAQCRAPSPIRVELYIDANGYAQGATFLDPWPNTCAEKYVQHIKLSKLITAPLSHPLEHFRVDIQTSAISTKQCIRMSQ